MSDRFFIRLLDETGTWAEFEADWRRQCAAYDEDFDGYAEATFTVVRDIILREHKDAGVYGLKMGGKFVAMAQINKATLPGYDSPVTRVRYLTMCPDLDFGSGGDNPYPKVLVGILAEVMRLARQELKTRHVKFHLRSPADQAFFTALGDGLSEKNVFESVATRGAWLYITDK